MFCEREEESQAIMDITGIGAGKEVPKYKDSVY